MILLISIQYFIYHKIIYFHKKLLNKMKKLTKIIFNINNNIIQSNTQSISHHQIANKPNNEQKYDKTDNALTKILAS